LTNTYGISEHQKSFLVPNVTQLYQTPKPLNLFFHPLIITAPITGLGVLDAIVGKNAIGKFYKAIINYFVIIVFGF
jgi:hypothetical protein